MKKRILALLLSICIIFSMVPALRAVAAGAETEFALNRIGYQGNYPRYLVYLDLVGVTDVSASTVPDGTKVVATVNGAPMNLWAYTAGTSQIFLVFEKALGNYVIEIDKGTTIGAYTVKSDLKIKITEYSAIQLEIIRLGIDTAKGSSGMLTANANARYVFYLTGLSGYSNWNENQTILINGAEHTYPGSANKFYFDATGYGSQTMYIYYDFLVSGATLADSVPETTVSIPAGTVFGNCITENTLSFTVNGYSLTVHPTEVNIESTEGSAWNGSQYILYLRTDLSYSLTTAQALKLTVNGTEQSVWLNPGNTPFVSCESAIAYGDNEIVVPKGTKLGDCVTAQDYTFYTHADGSVDTTPNVKTVRALSVASGSFRTSDWYIVLNVDNSAFELTAVAKLNATVDGAAASGWYQSNADMGQTTGKLIFTLETTKAEHTVTIPAGTTLGSYTLREDFVFYTHADGSVDVNPPSAPVKFSFHSGTWQGASNRYLVWLDDDVDGELTVPWAPLSVLAIDGVDVSVYATVDGGRVMLVLDTYAGISALGEHTVTLKKGAFIGNYEIADDVTFYTHTDGTVDTVPPVKDVSVSGVASAVFRTSDWYIVLNVDNSAFELTAVAKLNATVDGAAASGWYQSNADMGQTTGKLIFTLETTKDEHEIVIPAGATLGDYTLKEDFVFYTHADGTVDTVPPVKDVSVSGVASAVFRTSDWYIVLNVDNSAFELTAVAKLNATVDGAAASGWYQSNADMGQTTGKLIFTLETTKDEHEIVIPAGATLGDYTLKEDFVFYTHADGTVDTEAAGKEVSITDMEIGAFRTNDWYIVLDVDNSAFELSAVAKLVATVDGAAASGWYQSNADMGQTTGKLIFTLETTKDEHKIVIPAGATLGKYILKEDFVFYTHADGSADLNPPLDPVHFSFNRGVWQFVPDNNLARYLVWLEADIDGIESVPWAPLEGVTVNGEKKPVYATVDSGMIMLILDKETGITQPGKYTVTLKQGTYIGKYKIAQDVTFYADGLKVSTDAPVQIPEPSETVTVDNDSRNLNSSCTTGFYFQVSPADALPYDEVKGTISYGAATGGIYVNGELTPVTVTKWLENLYYVPMDVFGYTPQKGDVVTVDGVFGNGDHAVTFKKQSFVYDGEGNWDIGTYLRDLREQEYIVQDISELKLGLSQFDLEPGVTLLGEAKRSTNIAIRAIVSTGLETDEFNFGFSKIDGMWDVQQSGWQVWLRPQWSQVYLAHGSTEWQATTRYEFTKEQFVVEFGTVDMHEYIDGKDVGLYCRKIFLKIDGVEVLSYKDTDLNRNIGKKLFVLNSEDAVGSKLISLTTKGVTLREVTPTVYDYFDLTGFAADTIPGGNTVLLGETETSTNVAVRMKMQLSQNATEVRLALSKKQKDNFWDEEGSGVQLWLRPKWNMLYIAHGENEYEVLLGHQFSESFTLEFGYRDVVVEQDGQYIGTYCREAYVLIDGVEIASWEDTDFERPLGNCVMLLTSQDSATEIFTQRNTATLPVEIVVNGETVESCDLLKLNPQVVVGEDSKIALICSSDATHKTIFGGLYLNGEKLEPLDEVDGKATYLLEKPAQSDKLRAELTVKELTVDEPTAVFDLFDVAGVGSVEIPAQTTVSIGAMVNKEGQAAVNSAVRFAIRLPNSFNQTQVTILGDSATPWSTSGAMLRITPNMVNFFNPSPMVLMDAFACDLFAPGQMVCVEFGIVKCYENGVYRYDRWYVKAGKTADAMELVGWYDSVERGHYGAHFVCCGSDLEESAYLYSLKNVYSLTDESSDENKALLRTYTQLRNTLPELYYPSALVGYSTLEQAEQAGRIVLYTKPGTKLSRLTVNGQEVQFTIGADGAYCYTLPSVTGDVRFAYEITTDDTRYAVTAGGDDKLYFSIPEDGVLAGDDLVFTVTAQKGYVPQVTVNGTQLLLTVNEETGVWQGTVKSIRQDTQIVGVAVERSYNVSVNTPENGTVTLGGDVQNGKLPFGGKLEIAVLPNDGYYIQFVLVNGVQMPVNGNGTVVLDTVYWDADSLTVEAVFAQAKVPQVEQPQNDMTYIIWVGLAVLAVAVAAVVTVLLLRKGKAKEGNEKK